MTRTFAARAVLAGVLALALFSVATPAFAQLGTLTGKVVDDQGKPVADAELTFDYTGDLPLHFTAKTNAKGEWVRAGLMVAGRWTITAKKGNLSGVARNVAAPFGGSAVLPDIVIKAGAAPAAATGAADAAARAKQAEIAKVITEVNTAMAANDLDLAITKLNEAATKIDKCGSCYTRLGDVYVKKQNNDEAEKAYLKAIEADAASPEPYEALAGFYNAQRNYAKATEMSEKGAALRAASGGMDATAEFNAGAIAFNQTPAKIAEAKQHFQRAIQLKPDMAEAHFQLAMVLVNEGNVAEAKKSLEQYIKLSPNGPNAETAKAILAIP